MTSDYGFAAAEVFEAVRPKNSGTTVNSHVVRARPEPRQDFQKMKEAIEGRPSLDMKPVKHEG